MTKQDYRKMVTAAFRSNTYRGYADWKHCRRLCEAVTDVMCEAAEDRYLRPYEIFDVIGYAFLKWAKTDKDDSYGETHDFLGYVEGIWSKLPETDDMLTWIISHCDGSLIDYMEWFLLDYMMNYFKDRNYQERKMAYLEDRLLKAQKRDPKTSWDEYEVRDSKKRIMRLMGEMKYPIEEIRACGGAQDLLAEIELEYGNIPEAIALYDELAEKEGSLSCKYQEIVKNLYKKYGPPEKYEKALRTLVIREPGEMEYYREYKALFTPEEWPQVSDQLFSEFKIEDARVLKMLEAEGHYEIMMQVIEHTYSRELYLLRFENTLTRMFPERCLRILTEEADLKMKQALNRKDYRSLAETLEHIAGCKGGEKIAGALAQKYTEQYPRKTALREELESFL